MSSFWQFFDIQMAIFRRVRFEPHDYSPTLLCAGIQQECERKMKTVFKEIERLNESVEALKEKEEVYAHVLEEEIEEATTIKKKIGHKLAKAHWGAVKTTV